MSDPVESNLLALRHIADASHFVQDSGAKQHLRKAFVRLCVVSTEELFGTASGKPRMVKAYVNGGMEKKPETYGNVTISDEEFQFIADERKLEAVKAYKNRTGMSLLDSKNQIETWMSGNGYPKPRSY